MSDVRTLLRLFVAADEAAEAAAKEAKRTAEEAAVLEQRVWDHMDDEGDDYFIKNLGEGFGRVAFTKQETITASVNSASKARKSLTENNLGHLFDEVGKLRKKALNDEVRDWLRTGRRFLDGIGFFSKKYVTITRKPERKD